MRKLLLLLIFPLSVLQAQVYFPSNTAVKTQELNFQAFTNATIHLNPTTVLTDATLLEQNGRIVAVGQNLTLPKNTRVYDKSGTHIYPSFIELNSNFGVKMEKNRDRGEALNTWLVAMGTIGMIILSAITIHLRITAMIKPKPKA